MQLTAVITHEPPWYVARCVEVEVAAQGETADEATASLTEVLADIGSPVSAHPAVVRMIDVPVRSASGEGAPSTPRTPRADLADVADVVRRITAAGWQTERRGDQLVWWSPDRAAVVSLPVTARVVAPGVFRIVLGAIADTPREDSTEALGRLDTLFERHSHDDDTTLVVREQRDAR